MSSLGFCFLIVVCFVLLLQAYHFNDETIAENWSVVVFATCARLVVATREGTTRLWVLQWLTVVHTKLALHCGLERCTRWTPSTLFWM